MITASERGTELALDEIEPTVGLPPHIIEPTAEFGPQKENLISLLHRIQNEQEFHYIPEERIKEIADFLRITPSELYGVISFYSMFSTEPRGRYIVRMCRSAACHVMGTGTLIGSLKEILGIDVGETTRDNLFTLEVSSCLGMCDVAPAMMVNDEVYGNLTDERIQKILEVKNHE